MLENKPCFNCKFWKIDDLSLNNEIYYSCQNKNSDNFLIKCDYINVCSDKVIN